MGTLERCHPILFLGPQPIHLQPHDHRKHDILEQRREFLRINTLEDIIVSYLIDCMYNAGIEKARINPLGDSIVNCLIDCMYNAVIESAHERRRCLDLGTKHHDSQITQLFLATIYIHHTTNAASSAPYVKADGRSMAATHTGRRA